MKNIAHSIRAYDEAADLQALLAIWFDASLLAHAFIGEDHLRAQRVLVEEKYLPNAETWVACQGETPIGFVSLLGSHVGGLFVAPDQGQGIGRALVAHALALRGQLRLNVYVRNAKAFSFYKSLGFRELSRRGEDDEGLPFEIAELQLTS